jgi:hypothetical protein
MNEGLGILLMIIGVSMINDFNSKILNWTQFIPPIIACGGWMLYSFSKRINLK